MGIHSQFLVHWTGKCIEERPEAERSELYVKLLKDDLKEGLFTKTTDEDSIRGITIKRLVRLCFTEIRLSQALTHAKRYGRLGIGFTRGFIMDKGGRPVIYVPYDAKVDGCLLEKSIENVYKQSEGTHETDRSVTWILAHVKRMSNGKDEGCINYEDYYEEMEWRLVYDERSTHFRHDESKDGYRLPFEAKDVRVIIFPDENARRQSLSDKVFKDYFAEHLPIMATVEECGSL